MNLFNKLIFSYSKPEVIVLCGKNRSGAKDAVFSLVSNKLSAKIIDESKFANLSGKEDILIYETSFKTEKDIETVNFLKKNSSQFVLIATNFGDIRYDSLNIDGEPRDAFYFKEFIKTLDSNSRLVINGDDNVLKDLKNRTKAKAITCGFSMWCDFKASDINIGIGGTSFKVNNSGSSVPLRLKKIFGKENIYNLLYATAIGVAKKMNLVEISKAFENYGLASGKMKIVDGIKDTVVFDNSQNKNPYSLSEAIEVFGNLQSSGRKISVLGDIYGMGKYTISGYEEIGKKISTLSNKFFAIGPRTSFMATAAKKNGMAEENLYQFNDIGESIKEIQKEITPGDFIFIDGSMDMDMSKILEAVKKV